MRMISSAIWLRVSSIISALFAAGHTLGGQADWSPNGETDVLRAMRAYHFDVQGVTRTYMDFYRGFGWQLSVWLVLQAIVLWQLSRLASDHPHLVRPLVVTLAVASFANTLIALAYIFPVPSAFSVVLTICLGMAAYVRPTE